MPAIFSDPLYRELLMDDALQSESLLTCLRYVRLLSFTQQIPQIHLRDHHINPSLKGLTRVNQVLKTMNDRKSLGLFLLRHLHLDHDRVIIIV